MDMPRNAFKHAAVGQPHLDGRRGRSRPRRGARAQRAEELRQLLDVRIAEIGAPGHSLARQPVVNQRGQLRVAAGGQLRHHARPVFPTVTVSAVANAAAILELRPPRRGISALRVERGYEARTTQGSDYA